MRRLLRIHELRRRLGVGVCLVLERFTAERCFALCHAPYDGLLR
jgi:hypothetical protein